MSRPRRNILHDRAAMLQRARHFFAQRNVLEVDCPLLSASASVDAHIDLIHASPFDGKRFLHSSPEYGMKRLLTEGIGDIYQLSHVFRDGESGSRHNPEFMMAEWYRIGMKFEDLIQETADFIRLFLSELPLEVLSYRDAFKRYAGIDYVRSSNEELKSFLNTYQIQLTELPTDRDALLNLILGIVIEPQLGLDQLCALAYYPASQAALAQKCYHGDEAVCERFEIYYKGVELCNGYHELGNAIEQRERFIESNKMRKELGKEELPMDEHFLSALERGLPDCCGVAVGFDRLMMLRHGVRDIKDVIPFDWRSA